MNNTVEVIEVEDDKELNSRRGGTPFARIIILALVAAFVLLGGIAGAYFYITSQMSLGNKDDKNKITRHYASAPDTLGTYQPPPPLEEKQPVVEPVATPAPAKVPELVPAETIVIERTAAAPESNEPSLADRRYSSDISGYSRVQKPEAEVPTRQVKVMRNVDYALVKGTIIPCTLETNIISEQAGFVSCVISQDVYSHNARVLLIEKGSTVTGEYKRELRNGDKRLEVIWDRIITPYDVVVQLNSPAASRLGASGITGSVDNRWATRIGSALLVSLISDVIKNAGKDNQSADVIVDSDTADTSQDMAEKILEKNIDLPPIVYIQEGKMINIYVADDIDMSSIYNVQAWQ